MLRVRVLVLVLRSANIDHHQVRVRIYTVLAELHHQVRVRIYTVLEELHHQVRVRIYTVLAERSTYEYYAFEWLSALERDMCSK